MPRAAPSKQRLDRVVPFSAPGPHTIRATNRETQERWGSAEMYSPLMGGGYTMVLQRAAQEKEEAERKHAAAELERQLYFMSTREDVDSYLYENRHDNDENDSGIMIGSKLGGGSGEVGGRSSAEEEGKESSSEAVGAALRGWGMNTTRSKRSLAAAAAAARGGGGGGGGGEEKEDDDVESVVSVLPPPRGSDVVVAGMGGGHSKEEKVDDILGGDFRGGGRPSAMSHRFSQSRGEEGGGYGAQLAILGAPGGGGSRPTSRGGVDVRGSQRPRTPSIIF